jgi:uncharacterized protein (TIGR03790 family)
MHRPALTACLLGLLTRTATAQIFGGPDLAAPPPNAAPVTNAVPRPAAGTIPAPAPSPGEEVVVVYNLNWEPESRQVAEHYAARRGVPARHLIGLPLPRTEAISRTEFREQLQRPLVAALQERGLARFPDRAAANASPPGLPASQIRYLVLAYGVPVKITADPALHENVPEQLAQPLRRNEAAVDSELAALPQLERGAPVTGALINRLYATTNVAALHPTNGLFLVTRLDGPTFEIARALVDRALAAETNGLFGRAYFDVRSLPTNSPYAKGDAWIREAAGIARRQGFETVVDEAPETFPAWAPMPQIALYAGWYDSGVSGPFTREPVEFLPGAVAYHIHSFSARTLRHARAHWVGPLLARGAAVTMGCVEEPYLDLTPHVGVFFTWLIGLRHNFAQSAYAALPALSWQITVIGDPLYQPMARDPRELHAELERTRSPWLAWSVLRVVNLNLAVDEPPARLIEYLRQHPLTAVSAVLAEKLGDLYRQEKQPDAALRQYRAALALDPSPEQRLQLWFKLIELLTAAGRDAEALEFYTAFFKERPNHPGLLRFYEQALPLARKVGEAALAERFEQEIARLTPRPAATNAPPAAAPPSPNPAPGTTNAAPPPRP